MIRYPRSIQSINEWVWHTYLLINRRRGPYDLQRLIGAQSRTCAAILCRSDDESKCRHNSSMALVLFAMFWRRMRPSN